MVNSLILKSFIFLGTLFLLWACQPPHDQSTAEDSHIEQDLNPAAEGFDTVNSDLRAIQIADEVMEAMGGRSAWDQTRYISWNFFGNRKLIWDKQTGNVRIELADSTVYLVNVNEVTGKVLMKGEEISHADSLAKYLDRGNQIWINDSYWLVMPFKLKDSGVTLKYIGKDKTLTGTPSDVLELTFEGVGVTPQNKYLVYVDNATNLVNQWAYYREADQDSANFVLPWGDYKKHGGILLSGERGERDLTEVEVYADLPESIFTSLEAVDLSIYQ